MMIGVGTWMSIISMMVSPPNINVVIDETAFTRPLSIRSLAVATASLACGTRRLTSAANRLDSSQPGYG